MPHHEQRRERLRSLLRRADVDALLVTHATNVTYLTGFTGEDSYLLVTRDTDVLLSDPRYTVQLAEECPGLDLAIRRPGSSIVASAARSVRAARCGPLAIEAGSMTVETHQQLAAALPRVELRPVAGLVERLREIKDRHEVREIRQAIEIAERAFAVVKASLRPECSEKSVADALDRQVRLFGGAGCSFVPVVAVGARAALPHAPPGANRLEDSRFTLIDWGARGPGRYVSDLTRLVITGRTPPRLERIYQLVLNAQRAAIERIRPGAILEDIDAAARRVISAAGWGRRFHHSLGHGIGLEIHEQPRLGADQKRPMKAGMVVTVEPGVYLPGWGGVRIEDDVLVTHDGCEVLSACPREFADCHVT